MNKQELIRDIRSNVGGGGVITKTQIAGYLRKSRNDKEELNKLVEGLSYIPDGRGNKYFIVDVAGRILDRTIKQ